MFMRRAVIFADYVLKLFTCGYRGPWGQVRNLLATKLCLWMNFCVTLKELFIQVLQWNERQTNHSIDLSIRNCGFFFN